MAKRKRPSRNHYLQTHYGISQVEYDSILAAQGGVCAICKGKRPYNLAVDHDHAVEKAMLAQGVQPLLAVRYSVRGLLCKSCNNRLLPAAHDDMDILLGGIAYLDEWPADAVLAPLDGTRLG